jgi:hypothetical protein
MMVAVPETHTTATWLVPLLDGISGLLGTAGAYFMSKRYAKTFVSGAVFAIVGLGKYICGKGESVRKFYSEESRANRDIKDPAPDMAFGLSLVFLAFFVQIARIIVSLLLGKT